MPSKYLTDTDVSKSDTFFPMKVKYGPAFNLKVFLFSFIFCLVSQMANCQYGTTEGLILFTGEIVLEDSVTPLADVHLYNRNNHQITITDSSGFFSMYVSKIHVVQFTSIGYEPYYFSIPGGYQGEVYYYKIILQRSTTPLKNVIIFSKKEVTESMLRRENPPNPLKNISYGTLQGDPVPVEPGIMNPASLLWDWFSREGKEKRKLKAILKMDEVRTRVEIRFESDLIWELTGLYGEELDRFKVFCNLPQSFVLSANEYDFLLAIKSCYFNYKNQ